MGEGEGGMFQENSIETCILSRVKQITSPGWMHETSAWTWCTGKTQRDRVEREVGGGIGMGNTCKPMAVSFQCMTKSTTIKKIKKRNKRNYPVWTRPKTGWKKKKRAEPHTCGTITKDLIFTSSGCWEQKIKGKTRKVFDEIMVEDVSHFARGLNLLIQ